jgi:predicted transposase YbfD/YdcC
VSVYASELGLSLTQTRVEDKSNEITAIPLLLESLALKGAIITIDAMGTQKGIASAIIEREGDYLLALKGNKGELYDDVVTAFTEENLPPLPSFSSSEIGHGRIETRKCSVINDIAWLQQRHPDWAHIKDNCLASHPREQKIR